ncbi:hypothetical protein KAJ27_13860, partial [bacterium]|nr:hypothetical protein [bacterium]
MKPSKLEGIRLLFIIKNNITIIILLVMLIAINLLPVYSAQSEEEGKSFSLYYEGRSEYGVLDRNEDRDMVFRAMSNSLKFSKDLIKRPKFNINISDDLDFFTMGLTDYGIDKYDFHLLFNTFDLFSKVSVSESTSMDVMYEYETFNDYISPYDDNFVNTSNYILDDVLLHRLNDSRLFYSFDRGTFNLHKKFNLLEEDILFEYLKHKATFNFSHYITNLKKISFYGEYIDKDFKFSGIDDYTSGYAKVSYVQHFIPLKNLKKDYEEKQRKDFKLLEDSSQAQINMYDFKIYRKLFDIDQPKPPQVEY